MGAREEFGGGSRRAWTQYRSAILGIAVSVVCVVALLQTVDLGQVTRALAGATIWPLAISIALTFITVACRAWRWQALLLPDARARFWPAVEATLVGYLIIAVLPGRVGELSRAALLGRTERTSTARALGSIAIEKLYDVGALFVILGTLSVLIEVPGWARAAALAVGAAFTAFIVAFGLAVASRARLVQWFEARVDPLSVFRGRRPSRIAEGLLGAGSSFRSPRLIAVHVIATTVLWSIAIGQTYLGTLAFHLGTGWEAAAFLLVATNLGMTVPSAPASLGVYHGITVLSLEAFGTDREVALALAIGLHALGFGTLAVAGGACLAFGIGRHRFGLADLWRWRT